MGLDFSRIYCGKQARIVILGQPKSGKTSVLYALKLGSNKFSTGRTTGSNVEIVSFRNVKYSIWDIGGGDKMSGLSPQYCCNMDAIIFVVDSSNNDSCRLTSQHDAFHRIVDCTNVRNVPILILANKQDVPGAMTLAQIHECLELSKIQDRTYHLQPSCATSGVGLHKGFTWLTNHIQY